MLSSISLDAQDPAVVGAFWGAVLGRLPADAGEGDGTSRDVVLRATPDSPGCDLWVNGVPEPKTGKVRLHVDLDLRPGRGVEDLLALGATVVSEPGAQRWWVLADPEGHEFCAFPADGAEDTADDATNDADAEVAV